MLNLLFLLFVSTAAVSSLQCMEMTLQDSDKSSKKTNDKKAFFQKRSSKKSLSSPVISEQIHVSYIEHELITATRNKDYETIQFHLSNRYANLNEIRDPQKNTILHCAAMYLNLEVIEIFLKEPRIDSSIRNINNKLALDLINPHNNTTLCAILETNPELSDKISTVRNALFARATLDITTTQECVPFRLIYQKQGFITSNLMNDLIKIIRAKSKLVETNKQAEELPSSALLPIYANDDFIRDMVFFRLSLPEINNTWLK